MKKRIFVLALLVLAAFLLVGCADGLDVPEPLEFTRGYWQDGVYTNVFANLTFRLPEGWAYTTREQLDAMTEMLRTSPTNPDPDSQQFFDMIAREASASVSIVIIFEPLSPEVSELPEDYLGGMRAVYQRRDGILYVSEFFDETFGGAEYAAFYVQFDSSTSLTYFARRVGDYMLSISILRLELYDVLSYFS